MSISGLFPCFQPIVETATGRIAGYESLARRRTSDGRIVSAASLFTDPQVSTDERVAADRALRQQAIRWFAQHSAPDTYLSLNISPEWVGYIAGQEILPTLQMLEEAGLEPSRILIEITELDGNPEGVLALVERYREAGMRIALDDFGTGFSQLDRVASLSPDVIKLDMRFFKNGLSSYQSGAIVEMVGELGARLGSRIICEGIETEEEFFYALSCNASAMQGFFFDAAEAELIEPQKYSARVREMLEVYLGMAREQVGRQQWHNDKIQTQLLSIRQQMLMGEEMDWQQTYLPGDQLLRLYICDHQGNQISPNFENKDGCWIADSSQQGHNWAWRPYFYQLLGMDDYQHRMVSSSSYLDIQTGERCHTLALALDEQRILLADIRERHLSGSLIPTASCHSVLLPDL